jgi:hypothetical protein
VYNQIMTQRSDKGGPGEHYQQVQGELLRARTDLAIVRCAFDLVGIIVSRADTPWLLLAAVTAGQASERLLR